MGSIGARVAPDLLEPDRVDGTSQPVDLAQPVGEAQIAHSAAIEAAGTEGRSGAGDQTVMATEGPAGRGAEIKGEDA